MVMSIAEAHYCCLESQSNVYGLAKFSLPEGLENLLVASVRGNVISLKFQKNSPCSRSLNFTYIPGDAEIVSIDAFNKLYHGNGVVIGISFSKPADNRLYHYLNIYSEVTAGAEFDLDRVVQGCVSLELGFMPCYLWHTELEHGKTTEVVFLLSGNDQRIHLFREDRSAHTFQEDDIEEFFPEFTDLPSNVVWCCIHQFWEARQRVSAVGCSNGSVKVSVVNTLTRELIKSLTTQHDSPITSLSLFSIDTDIETPSFFQHAAEASDDGLDVECQELHLLVGGGTDPAIVYRDVLKHGMDDVLVLPDSDKYDSVLCVKVADIDFDGQNELLLGTYGHEILVYKYCQPQSDSREELKQGNASEPKLGAGYFKMLWSRALSDPVLAIDHIDMTGDGMKELVALSLKGLHVLQYDLEPVKKLCLERIKQACEQFGLQEDVFKQLLSENLSS